MVRISESMAFHVLFRFTNVNNSCFAVEYSVMPFALPPGSRGEFRGVFNCYMVNKRPAFAKYKDENNLEAFYQ